MSIEYLIKSWQDNILDGFFLKYMFLDISLAY